MIANATPAVAHGVLPAARRAHLSSADIAARLTAARRFVADVHAQIVADAPAGHQVSLEASSAAHLAEAFLSSLVECLTSGNAYQSDAEAADLEAYKAERDAEYPTFLVTHSVECHDLVDSGQVCEVAA